MDWRKVSIYALIILGILGSVALLGWGLSRWTEEQVQVEEPRTLSPVATATPAPTLTPGWWDSPLPVPTRTE